MSQVICDAADPTVDGWERGFDRVVVWIPYATLALSLGLGLLTANSWADRWLVTGAVLGAGLWTLIMFTLPGGILASQVRIRIYFLGFVAFGLVLMMLSTTFFPYIITGFIHAFALKPAPVAFLGIGSSSLLVNLGIVESNPSPESWWTYGVVVAIQTTVVGIGVIGGEKIARLSEERGRSLRELENAVAENADLQAQLVAQAREAGVVDERQRMAREIHDTIAQGLTGVITQLEAAGQVKKDPEGAQHRIDNASKLARESLAEARRSVQELTPVPLEDRSLPDAITHVSEKWASLNQVPTEVTTTGASVALRPEVEVTMLRITQEALANVAKHANASRVGVTLSYMDDVLTLDVRDDGVGFVMNGSGGGFGVRGMRQRVEALAGTLDIESAPGEGTAISARLPAIPVGDRGG